MGCGTSGDPQSDQVSTDEGADMLDIFLRLEKEIYQEERAPPAPALSHGIIRLNRAVAALEGAQMDMYNVNEELFIPGSVSDVRAGKEDANDAIRRAIQELGLNRKPELSAEHEEFIANLNRRGIMETRINWLMDRREEAQEEVDRLTDRVQHLQALYEHHEAILRNFENEGESDESKELGRLRAYRDALYNGELSWREATKMVEAASALARAASSDWDQAKDTQDEEIRWKLGVEARKGLQEATLCIQSAQAALSGVQFPHCTPRELATVLQALDYLFTDMQIPERYNHASHLYNSFHKRASALHVWLKKVMEETIHKDVLEVDKRYGQLATKVTNQRINLLRQQGWEW
nr:uncharacterized protein LOC106680869 isoform X2 [Halyomorpha halys]